MTGCGAKDRPYLGPKMSRVRKTKAYRAKPERRISLLHKRVLVELVDPEFERADLDTCVACRCRHLPVSRKLFILRRQNARRAYERFRPEESYSFRPKLFRQ